MYGRKFVPELRGHGIEGWRGENWFGRFVTGAARSQLPPAPARLFRRRARRDEVDDRLEPPGVRPLVNRGGEYDPGRLDNCANECRTMTGVGVRRSPIDHGRPGSAATA